MDAWLEIGVYSAATPTSVTWRARRFSCGQVVSLCTGGNMGINFGAKIVYF